VVALHEHGIQVKDLAWNAKKVDIHRAQVIALERYTTSVDHTVSKSVVGRAIVGGLLTGGVGAIVGGMSGIGSKTQTKVEHYLLLQYWRVADKKIQTFLLKSDKMMIDNVVSAFYK